MSLKFINEEVEGEINEISMFCCELNYKFKELSIHLKTGERNIVIRENDISKRILARIPIDEPVLYTFWKNYILTKKISDKFEKEVQDLINDSSYLILEKMVDLYNENISHSEKAVERELIELNDTKLKYEKFKETYEKEIIFI